MIQKVGETQFDDYCALPSSRSLWEGKGQPFGGGGQQRTAWSNLTRASLHLGQSCRAPGQAGIRPSPSVVTDTPSVMWEMPGRRARPRKAGTGSKFTQLASHRARIPRLRPADPQGPSCSLTPVLYYLFKNHEIFLIRAFLGNVPAAAPRLSQSALRPGFPTQVLRVGGRGLGEKAEPPGEAGPVAP